MAEWKSPNFHSSVGKLILLSIVSYLTILYLIRARISWLILVVPAALLWAQLTSIRNISFWAITLTAFLALGVSHGQLPELVSRFKRSSRSGQRDIGRGAAKAVNVTLVLLTMTGFFLAQEKIRSHWGRFYDPMIPRASTEYMVANLPGGKVFNMYGSGGYMLWRAPVGFPIFVDGRYAPYGEKIIEDYLNIVQGGRIALRTLADYDVEIVSTATGGALAETLATIGGYRRVYGDSHFELFVIDNEKYAGVRTAVTESTKP